MSTALSSPESVHRPSSDLYALDASGALVGTGTTDTVSVTGVSRVATTYAGTVTYTATVG